MNLEKRINKLEENISKMYVDPRVDAELTEWFKSNPEYNPFAQSKEGNEDIMPEKLRQAFMYRVQKLFKEKNLQPNFSNLLKIYTDLFFQLTITAL
ncbi:MAG: hypothetical protein K1060chlam1_01173 [Candidatus Anoxychlamydiales bacterium]|nr:hypothetical protein [Candidatus Anoxychlamydiales bacterium]